MVLDLGNAETKTPKALNIDFGDITNRSNIVCIWDTISTLRCTFSKFCCHV